MNGFPKREWWQHPVYKRAKRHPKYGYSPQPNGGVLHLVNHVSLYWEYGEIVDWQAQWGCADTNWCRRPVLTNEAGNLRRCPRCDFDDLQQGHKQVVYIARVGELIKVGCTERLHQRMLEIGGELLHWMPGGPEVEQSLLGMFRSARVEEGRRREWFRNEGPVADYLAEVQS